MKKLLFICTLSLGLIFTSYAQRGGNGERQERTPEALAERMSSRMAEELELSETQKKEVYDLQLAQIKERMASREEMSTERQAAMAAHQEKIDAVLTPEQKQKWEEMRKEGRENRGAWRDREGERPEGPARRGGGPNRGGRGNGAE